MKKFIRITRDKGVKITLAVDAIEMWYDCHYNHENIMDQSKSINCIMIKTKSGEYIPITGDAEIIDALKILYEVYNQ